MRVMANDGKGWIASAPKRHLHSQENQMRGPGRNFEPNESVKRLNPQVFGGRSGKAPNAMPQTIRESGNVAGPVAHSHDHTTNKGHGTGAKLQKLERDSNSTRGQAVPDDREARKSMDESSHREFQVAIALRFSDDRTHDPDGCTATLLDCIVTCRRQLEAYTGAGSHQQ